MTDQHPPRSAILTAAATIWSPQVIADELNLPLAEVEATLAEAAGYGTAPNGLGAYGRCRGGRRATLETLSITFYLILTKGYHDSPGSILTGRQAVEGKDGL